MGAKVLVVEDDPKQASLVRMYFEREGHFVMVATDGLSALEAARRRPPDLVVLDVMIPRMDGLDVLRALRAESDVPVIMLTARAGEDDLLVGLDLGADDYVTKPFSPRELVARARAVLRRRGGAGTPALLQVGALVVDTLRHEVSLDGRLVDVTPKEFALLEVLAREPGRAFTRLALVQAAFGFDYEGLDRTVDVHVLNIRKKLEGDPTRPEYVLTVYGVGYKMAECPGAP